MKIGLHEWSTEKKADFLTNVMLAKKYGYECIELLQKNTDEYLKDHTIEEMRGLLLQAGIRPSALSGLIYFNLLKPEEKAEKFAEFERLAKICTDVGCKTLILVASPHQGENNEEIRKDAVAVLQAYAELADTYGIRLAVEFLGFKWASINDFGQCYEIVRAVNRDCVGIALDCFHFYANGSKIEDLKKADGKKIFALHINDVKGKPVGEYVDDSLRLLPGDGEIPLIELFDIFDDIGIRQTPCIELFNEEIWNWDPEFAIKTFKEKIEFILKQSNYNN